MATENDDLQATETDVSTESTDQDETPETQDASDAQDPAQVQPRNVGPVPQPPKDPQQQGDFANRKERRTAYARQQDVIKDQGAKLASLEQINRQLMAKLESLSGSVGQMVDQQRQMLPKPPDPVEEKLAEVEDRMEQILAQVREKPEMLKEYRKLERERYRIIAQAEADAKLTSYREETERSAPKPLDESTQQVVAEFPWLRTDPEAREAANAIAKRIAKGKDLDNPAVKLAVMREAATKAAIAAGIPLPKQANNGNGAARVAGTGSAGVSRGAPVMPAPDQFTLNLAEAWANSRNLGATGDNAYKLWWNAVGRHQQQQESA